MTRCGRSSRWPADRASRRNLAYPAYDAATSGGGGRVPRMTRAVLAAQAEALRRRFRALKGRLGQSQRAADDLRQSESRPRSLFEHADDLIVSCRLDGTITDVNRATEKTLGGSRGELIGHNIARIVTLPRWPSAKSACAARWPARRSRRRCSSWRRGAAMVAWCRSRA